MTYKIPLSKIKELNREKGQYWFEPATTRFFKSKYPRTAKVKGDYAYFVTSETNPSGQTAYSIRQANLKTGDIDTIGDFHAYKTRQGAEKELNKKFFSKTKKRGNLFTLESENGEVVRVDEYGNKEYMVKGSGGNKWIDKETGEIRE